MVVNGQTVPMNATFAFFSSKFSSSSSSSSSEQTNKRCYRHIPSPQKGSGGVCSTFNGTLNQGQVWDLVCTAYDIYGKEKLVGGDTVTYVTDGSVVVV